MTNIKSISEDTYKPLFEVPSYPNLKPWQNELQYFAESIPKMEYKRNRENRQGGLKKYLWKTYDFRWHRKIEGKLQFKLKFGTRYIALTEVDKKWIQYNADMAGLLYTRQEITEAITQLIEMQN